MAFAEVALAQRVRGPCVWRLVDASVGCDTVPLLVKAQPRLVPGVVLDAGAHWADGFCASANIWGIPIAERALETTSEPFIR